MEENFKLDKKDELVLTEINIDLKNTFLNNNEELQSKKSILILIFFLFIKKKILSFIYLL